MNLEDIQTQIDRLKQLRSEIRRSSQPTNVREYTFKGVDGSSVRLRDLFGNKSDLIIVHNMGSECPYCTMWADGFNGVLRHLTDRAAFVVSSPDTPERMRTFALSRGWKFDMVSHAGSTFARDMGFESEAGQRFPGVSAFALKQDGQVVRTGSDQFGPHDDYCAVWPMFDLLRNGVEFWRPQFAYAASDEANVGVH